MINFLRKNFQNVVLLGTIGFLYIVSTALTPFFIGITIAYIARPIVSLTAKRINKNLAVVLGVTLTYSFMVLMLLLVLPFIYNRFSEIANTIMGVNLESILKNQELNNFLVLLKDIIISKIPGYVTEVVNTVISSTQALISLVFSMIFAPIISMYFLQSIGRNQNKTIRYLDNLAENFVKIQMLMIVFYAIYYFILMSLLDINESITLSVISGVLYIIPYIGPIAGCVISSLMTISHYGIDFHLAVLIGGFVVMNILDNIFITPKLIGPKFGLHPLMTIFSLVVNSYLFGVAGMILAVPLGVVMKDLWELLNRGVN